jgi:hypothetical protein
MSEFIDVISPEALREIEAVNAKIVETIKLSKEANKNLIGAKTPSGSDSALKALTAEYEKQQKVIQNLQNQLVKLAEKQNQQAEKSIQAKEKERLAELKLQKARENAFDKYDAQLTKEQAKLNASANLYNKVQAKLNSLSNEYKALATRKELGIALTDKESQRYAFLQGKIQTYDKTLKAVDATMGKYTRNVGNYASGFNPLNNSIQQLTREMPAFTYSVQTGFMALSNNIPIFTDAISNAINQNKQLQAEGKPTTSVLKQLSSAFFGWGTALSVAITLTTVYGKEIGNFVSGLFKTKRGFADLSTQLAQYNDALKKTAELSAKEISELDRLYKVANDTTIAIDSRRKAVDKLQELYPNYLANISDENILNGKAEKQYYKLRDAIIAKYAVQAIGDKLSENARDRLEEYIDLEQEVINAEKRLGEELNANNGYRKRYVDLNTQGRVISIKQGFEDEASLRLLGALINERNKAQINLNQFKKDSLKEDSELIRLQEKLMRASIGVTEANKEQADMDEIVLTGKKKKNDETKKEIELLQGAEAWYEKQISSLKQIRSTTADTTEEYKSFNAQLGILEDGLKALRGELAQLEGEGLKLDFEAMGLTADGFEKWRKSGSESGEELTNDWKDQFQEWSSVALDAIQTVRDAQEQAYQAELSRLERSRDTAILFAGESESARAEIDRQYDQKRRALLNRQAKQEKAMAITQSIINTAGAVIATLRQTPPPAGIPLAIAVGVIGSAQTALIASQQIPQFYKGTDNAPEGLAWTQERGAELITDKNGKIKSIGSDKGAQLTYLNKGDKVFDAKKTQEIMFNNELNGILMNNGISNASTIVNNNVDLSPLNARIDNLTNVIKNKPEWSLVRDVQGERLYQKEQGMRKLLVSNRLRIKG